jgi:hypothetical protein
MEGKCLRKPDDKRELFGTIQIRRQQLRFHTSESAENFR